MQSKQTIKLPSISNLINEVDERCCYEKLANFKDLNNQYNTQISLNESSKHRKSFCNSPESKKTHPFPRGIYKEEIKTKVKYIGEKTHSFHKKVYDLIQSCPPLKKFRERRHQDQHNQLNEFLKFLEFISGDDIHSFLMMYLGQIKLGKCISENLFQDQELECLIQNINTAHRQSIPKVKRHILALVANEFTRKELRHKGFRISTNQFSQAKEIYRTSFL